jgi:hypothetical protein
MTVSLALIFLLDVSCHKFSEQMKRENSDLTGDETRAIIELM